MPAGCQETIQFHLPGVLCADVQLPARGLIYGESKWRQLLYRHLLQQKFRHLDKQDYENQGLLHSNHQGHPLLAVSIPAQQLG